MLIYAEIHSTILSVSSLGESVRLFQGGIKATPYHNGVVSASPGAQTWRAGCFFTRRSLLRGFLDDDDIAS